MHINTVYHKLTLKYKDDTESVNTYFHCGPNSIQNLFSALYYFLNKNNNSLGENRRFVFNLFLKASTSVLYFLMLTERLLLKVAVTFVLRLAVLLTQISGFFSNDKP